MLIKNAKNLGLQDIDIYIESKKMRKELIVL